MELERKDQRHHPGSVVGNTLVQITPPLDHEFWSYRVRLGHPAFDTGTEQAIVGFPKFGTIGIGFAVEEDWNTNLPYTCGADDIYGHIAHNKGNDEIARESCLEVIRLVQEAAREDRAHADKERTENQAQAELRDAADAYHDRHSRD